MSKEHLKKQAKNLRRLLPDFLEQQPPVPPLAACQELAAKINGYPNFHSAISVPETPVRDSDQPRHPSPSGAVVPVDRIKRGSANEEVNRNEEWISEEVYDLYRFLMGHPRVRRAPHRFKDILRGSLNGTKWGYFVDGLVSAAAADQIDTLQRKGAGQPTAGLQRDHIFPWNQTALFFLDSPVLSKERFWAEIKRRSEVCFVLKSEHTAINRYQATHGLAAYRIAGVDVYRVPADAFDAKGYSGGLGKGEWPSLAKRAKVDLERAYGAPLSIESSEVKL